MIKLEKKKSCIIWILMTVICTFFVCMIGNVSVEAKTVTKDITIGKGKTYAIEQTFSGKATFKTSNKKIAVIKNGKIIGDRKSTRLNSSHKHRSRMPSSA